ncbi:SRPBCC family protein [Changchengzhania lutea]|uniref:SRPBCC family protein n=1 Tax=Changchengzhania lutea TaxID=2049305 RepID=UPI00115E344B|nr:SRPBCC family protein [Changchengzhania lutea]
MKLFKYILFLLLIAIIGTAIYIAVQPNDFRVSRTRTIKAPAAVVYNKVIDFKTWESWSSWIEDNPDIKITLDEKTSGVGGSYSWIDGNSTGTMKTVSANPHTSITQVMKFDDMPASDVVWEFEPNKDRTTDVTCTMSGNDLPFMFKAFTAFSGGMEAEVGPHYERNLEKLEDIVVKDMQQYSVTVNGLTNHSGGYYLYNTTSCKINELETKMQEMLPQVTKYAMDNNITMAGAPFVNYLKWDDTNNAVIFSSCVPTTEKVITTDSNILTGQLLPFKAIKTTLKGDYSNLKEAWDKAMAYIPANGFEFADNGPMLEIYGTNPKETPNPANWITEIYIAVK